MESVKCDKCGITDSKDRYVSSFNIYCEKCKTPNAKKVRRLTIDIKSIEKKWGLVNKINETKVVYVLYETDENEIIGVYDNLELAETAKKQVFCNLGYSETNWDIDYHFDISEFQINKTIWEVKKGGK